jgi:putative transposase
VPYFNRRHTRTGGLWEGRFKPFFIDTNRYFFECLRYIDLNPVRAGIVAIAEEYRWCSYRTNARGFDDPLITPHRLYEDLGSCAAERQARYRSLCAEAVNLDKLTRIRHVLNRQPTPGLSPRVGATCSI